MHFSLAKIKDEDVLRFKKDMQDALQKGFEDVYGQTNQRYGNMNIIF